MVGDYDQTLSYTQSSCYSVLTVETCYIVPELCPRHHFQVQTGGAIDEEWGYLPSIPNPYKPKVYKRFPQTPSACIITSRTKLEGRQMRSGTPVVVLPNRRGK